jgi:hypothetical protein
MPIVRRTRLFNDAFGVELGRKHFLCPSSTRPQPAKPGITTCVIKQSCSPDDGHNDA